MKTPIFHYAATRETFASLSRKEWTPRRSIQTDDCVLLKWTKDRFVERRLLVVRGRRNSYEYRRLVDVPPVVKSKPRKRKAYPDRLPTLGPDISTPSRGHVTATPEQVAAWRDACARVRSLPALLGMP